MKKIITAILLGVISTGFAGMASAASTGAATTYKLAQQSAEAHYKMEHGKCNALTGTPAIVCVAEAEAERTTAQAIAKAEYKHTPRARTNARIAIANAGYDVAKAKCDSRTGNEKDVCLKEAAAVNTAAKVDAKTHAKIVEIRHDANVEKSAANYKVAREQCNAFAGEAKDHCVASAKSRFSM